MSEQDQRAMFIADLTKMVEDIIPEARAASFDASRWVTCWLATPQFALGGRTPEELMVSAAGRASVRRLLETMESGAYV
jgi:uncharacterized protein (DUF2384 family)